MGRRTTVAQQTAERAASNNTRQRSKKQTVPWWQLALSVVLMIVSIAGELWVASRIYRIGILMYGKRPTLPEIVKWLRYAKG